jgi:hypothetical protein
MSIILRGRRRNVIVLNVDGPTGDKTFVREKAAEKIALKREEVSGDWRSLSYEELHYLYSY